MDCRRVIGVGLLLALPLSAVSKPAYLKCKLDGNEKSFIVTVDEEQGRVTMPVGPVFDKARFTADEINFEQVEASRTSRSSKEYSIDRSTLAYTTIWRSYSTVDGKPREVRSTGQCEVTSAPERKI